MNINGLQVDQRDVNEVRTFRQALLTRNQQQYPYAIQQLVYPMIQQIDPSHPSMPLFVQYVQNLSLHDRNLLLRGFIDAGYPMITKLLLSHGVILGGLNAIWTLIDVAVMREKGFLVKFLFEFYDDHLLYEYLINRRRLFSVLLYAFGREPFDEITRTILVKQLLKLHECVGGDLPLYRNAFLAVIRERSPDAYQRLVDTFRRLKIRMATVVQRKYKKKHKQKVNAVKIIQHRVENFLYRPGQEPSHRGTVRVHGYRVPVRDRFIPKGILYNTLMRNFNALKVGNQPNRHTTKPRLRNVLRERRNTLSRERTVRKLTRNIMKHVIERQTAAYSRRIRPPTGNRVKELARRFNR